MKIFFKIFYLKIILLIFSSTDSNGQIILSEVMFDPIGSEYYNEFIEIYNISATDTIDLANWQISDSSDIDFLISHEHGTHLKPQQYAIILDPGYFENSEQYENVIPADALILTIDDGSFGSQGLSNSYPESIILISSTGDTAAKYQYTLDNQPGYSDEKRNLFGDDSPQNWANSKVLNGTPGFENSARQFNYDISLELLGFPPAALPNQTISLIASVTNVGLSTTSNIEIEFFEDLNQDSILSTEEKIGSTLSLPESLKVGENCQVRITVDSLAGGAHYFYARALCPDDQDNSNNLASTEAKIGFPNAAIVINEIMYRPSAGQAEWIELYNPGNEPINVQQWQFSDAHIDNRITLSDTSMIIAGLDYLIIAEDSTIFYSFPDIIAQVFIPPQGFPALNNSGDQIVLYDLIGTIIDQVRYDPMWGSELGVTLERKQWDLESNNPSNWEPSIDITGATPGRFNSVSPIDFDLAVTAIYYTPKNSFPNEEITISVFISNVGRISISNFKLTCYVDLNQDSTFQNDEKIGQTFAITQLIEQGEVLSVQVPYIPSRSGRFWLNANLSAETDFKTSNNSHSVILSVGFKRRSLVINEIMYSPKPGQPEWIELYNPKSTSIDIQNWKYSDSDSTDRRQLLGGHFFIDSHSFLILAADSSLSDFFNLMNNPLFTISGWQVLNNDQDNIFIFDSNNNIIDEVHYNSKWGGDNGVSLERINPNLASDDSSNWSSCVETEEGGTPGRKNSIYVEVLPTDAELTISPNPFSPDGDGRDDFTIINYQLPFNLSKVHVKIYDIRGREIRFLINNQTSGTTGSIIWDGRDNQGHICRMGIYVVYLEAIHYQRGVVKSLKNSVVLANRL